MINAEELGTGPIWFVHDEEGFTVQLRRSVDGGLLVCSGNEKVNGVALLSAGEGFRIVGAVLDFLGNERPASPVTDMMPANFSFPWWAIDSRAGDGIRRGVILADTSQAIVLCAGRVHGPGAMGSTSLPHEDAARFAEAVLAILEDRDPWEATG